MTRFRNALAAVVTCWVAFAAPAMADLRLLMFEQQGCPYCRKWHNQLGDIYPKTTEGAVAPLRSVNLRKPVPDDITLTGGKPQFTPTFVLVRDGVELGRITGYPGEDFFWGLLDKLLESEPEWAAPPVAAAKG